MQKIIDLSKKRKRKIIGLMSGTSVDAVDTVLIEAEGSGRDTSIKLLGYSEYPIDRELKKFILKNSLPDTSNVDDICRLNFIIPHLYFSAIKKLVEKTGITLDEVDLTGTHGQTIRHLPEKVEMFGFSTGSTLQIGDPAVLAKLTGVITVGDFRTGDVALGGQGAPLVPYFDYIMFHSPDKNRALLNIGGISNITVLNKEKGSGGVIAFDTGPGNMMIDTLTQEFFNKAFDANGDIAFSGKIDKKLLERIRAVDEYPGLKPPKSTGRERYDSKFIARVRDGVTAAEPADIISTFSYYTALTIFENYQQFIKNSTKIEELFVSGGGAYNKFIMKHLAELFGPEVNVTTADDLGIPSDAKEAVCFAVLANETISGNSSNIINVTGAVKETILGKICLP